MSFRAFTVTERSCAVCQEKYLLGPFDFDSGTCKKCTPGFFCAPLWLRMTSAGTLALWKMEIIVHAIFFLLYSALLDDGTISTPGMIYCLTVIFYFTLRIWKGKRSNKGFPVLTRIQRLLLVLLFIWGNVEFHILFGFTQGFK